MDDDKAVVSNRKTLTANNGHRKVGGSAVGTNDVARTVETSAVTWEYLSAELEKKERSHKNLRIVKVWHPSGPEIYQGIYGNAVVEKGKPAYQFNTGGIHAI